VSQDNRYAIIKTGGKQYRVQVGSKLKIELLSIEAGEECVFDQVLLRSDGTETEVGAPLLDASVKATVLKHGRRDKIRIFKMRRRKNSRRSRGHRQYYTEVQVTAV
jgi:large subunit ribosomal protein L21